MEIQSFGRSYYSIFLFYSQKHVANLTIFHNVVSFHITSCKRFSFHLDTLLHSWTPTALTCVDRRTGWREWLWRVTITFADVTGDAADLTVDHLLVKLFDVERLDGEGKSSCQHGEHAHTPAYKSRMLGGGGRRKCTPTPHMYRNSKWNSF